MDSRVPLISGNHPPDIDGPLEIYATTGVNISGSYSVDDRDGHDIAAFTLKVSSAIKSCMPYSNLSYCYTYLLQGSIPEGFSLNVESDGTTASLVWTNPGSELPAYAIQVFANDSQGASIVRNISVILCACANNGMCINSTAPQYNSNGHNILPCLCPDFFSGDLCDVDTRGCSDTACPEFSVCMDNDSVPEGYTCTDCEEGYYLDDDGKCSGMGYMLFLTSFFPLFPSFLIFVPSSTFPPMLIITDLPFPSFLSPSLLSHCPPPHSFTVVLICFSSYRHQ